VTIDAVARDGDEEVTRLQATGIGADAVNLHIAAAGQHGGQSFKQVAQSHTTSCFPHMVIWVVSEVT
jgi:hypothetical protein